MARGTDGRVGSAVGVIFALGVAVVAAVFVLYARLAPPRTVTEPGFVPVERWPWWPGSASIDQTLLVFVAALLLVGVAAFVRRPRSGIAQALLAGSSANAASIFGSTTVQPQELGHVSTSWAVFLGSGFLTLILWSSLVHLAFVFPARERRLKGAGWVVSAVYVMPPTLLAAGVFAIGALPPTSLDWVARWGTLHAAIVSLLLVVALAGIAARYRAVSRTRRRQVRPIAIATAFAAGASLLLVDLPVMLTGRPALPRTIVALAALPIPIALGAALWRDRGFRIDRLRRSQMVLLHAREEERRRVRRDLHDGLGPTLAAVGLKLDAATSWVARDPARAERLLTEARTDLTRAISEMRRAVRGLRPPGLDDVGLVEAIRRAGVDLTPDVGDLPTITVLAGELPPLPAIVEVTALRIAQEALTNVVRHARATRCEVRLEAGWDGLRIIVTDDGTGLDRNSRRGVGTESMRERAEALGGDLWIEKANSGGTRIVASLPVRL